MADDDLLILADLLDEAFDLGEDARAPWLADLHRTQPKVAVRLEALLQRTDELKTDHLLVNDGRSVTPEALADVMEANRNSETARANAREFVLQTNTNVGPYRLIKPLGEGGMASVWLAERSDGQLKREVALKLLHAWRNSRDLVERFARERDMLAGLVHPNIARLYDAGVTESGQPWIALEYVEGVDLATYADSHRLTIRARIDAMLQVMSAVQHAHQNLIVHRDLKPTNILVNNKGEVRLLDFGIAKLLQAGDSSAAETELTKDSGRALTLRYAAPEQIKGEPVTTATDVYALGLVLYELLTGSSPRTGNKTKIITEQAALSTDVLRPSRGTFTEEISHRRGDVSARELKTELAGDLDTILLKALARDPARRYRTVDALGEDLRAWTEHRPIAARAPSFSYQLKMLLVRQRVPVAVGCLVFLALGASGVFAWKQRLHAEQQSARAAQVQMFMANLLSAAEPQGEGLSSTGRLQQSNSIEKTLTVKDLLDSGLQRARSNYGNDPLLLGYLLAQLGHTYLRIGEGNMGSQILGESIALLEKRAPAQEPMLVRARAYLGAHLLRDGNRDQGLALLAIVLRDCDRATYACRNAMGMALMGRRQDQLASFEQKRADLRAAIELFEQDPDTAPESRLQALVMFADDQRRIGNLKSAREMLDKAEILGALPDIKATERTMLGITSARLAFDEGGYDRAALQTDQLIAALEGTRRDTAKIQLHTLRARIANYRGLPDVAIESAAVAREISDISGPSVNLAYAHRYAARALAMRGDFELARATVDEALNVLRFIKVGDDSEEWMDMLRARAEIFARHGDNASARKIFEKVLSDLRTRFPAQIKDRINTLSMLGVVSLAMGDATAARTYHAEEVELAEKTYDTGHPIRLRASLQFLCAQHFLNRNLNLNEEIFRVAGQLRKILPSTSTHHAALADIVDSVSKDASHQVNQTRAHLIF